MWSNATDFVLLMSQNKENKLFARWGVKEWGLSRRKRKLKKQSKREWEGKEREREIDRAKHISEGRN